jgi:hypothetical protein
VVAPQKQKVRAAWIADRPAACLAGQLHKREPVPTRNIDGLGQRFDLLRIAQHGLLGHEVSRIGHGFASDWFVGSRFPFFLPSFEWSHADQVCPNTFLPTATASSRGLSGSIGRISAGFTREEESWFLVSS